MTEHAHTDPSTQPPSSDDDRSFQIPPPPDPNAERAEPKTRKSGSGPRSYNPPPPRNSKGGKWILLGVAILFIGFIGLVTTLLLAGFLFGGSGGSSNHYRESAWLPGTSGMKIVVIPVNGIISSQPIGMFGGSATVDAIRERLTMASADPKVVAIILDVNSPGGEVTATDEIHHLIKKIRKEKNIVFVTCMRSVAASGGYYLAAGTDHVVANRLTMTGSIGVVIGGVNYSKLLEKIGIEGRTFKSGPMKDMGNPSRHTKEEIADYRLELKRRLAGLPSDADPLAKEEAELIRQRLEALDQEEEIVRRESELFQKMVDDSFLEFAKVVAEGRKIPLETVTDRNGEIGNAQVVSGADALRLKLVDQIGFMDDAIAFARKSGNHAVVQYEPVPGLFDALTGNVKAEKTGMIKELLPEELRIIKKGRLYYLNPNLF